MKAAAVASRPTGRSAIHPMFRVPRPQAACIRVERLTDKL
jgi:hypothetical protein